MEATAKFKLKKFIKELSSHRARHTELVTVYVPEGYDLNKIIGHLSDEQGTASNIKSSTTRNNVTSALERMIQHLRLFKRTPEKGLAVFSGNISEREGVQDVRVWSIEPPLPLKVRMYRCDKEFILDPFTDMIEEKEMYGLVVMDRRDGDLAYLRGKTIIPLLNTHSAVPGKFKAGGQSSARFARARELAAKEFYKRIADYMNEQFLPNTGLKGIIIGGPGPTKYEFAEGNFITGDLKKKIIGIKDLSYTGDFGMEELVDRSQDLLAAEDIATEKAIMLRFFETLAKQEKKVSYGEKEVRRLLGMGMVDVVLISENFDEDKIVEIEEEAAKFSTVIKIISTETREGVQLRDIGGIAAILRYELHE